MSCPNPELTEEDFKIFDTISKANDEFKKAAGDSLSRTRSGAAYSSMSGGEKKAGIVANIIAGVLCFAMAGGSAAAVYLLMTTPAVSQALGIVTPCRGALEQVLGIFGGWVGMTCGERQTAWDSTLTRAMTIAGVTTGSSVLAMHQTIAKFIHKNTGRCKRKRNKSSSSSSDSSSSSRSSSRSLSSSGSSKKDKKEPAAGAGTTKRRGGSRRYKNSKRSRSRKSRK